jgi:hypothetical protein
MTVTKGSLSVSASGISSGTNRSRTSSDRINVLSFGNNSGNSVTLKTVAVTFSGSAISYNNGPFAVSLNMTSGSSGWQSNTQWDASRNAWVATINLQQRVIPALSTESFYFIVDSSGFLNSSSSDSLVATILNTGDVTWNDGTTDLGLDATVVPFTIANITYQ